MSEINEQCPSSARLAAWIDGRLSDAERAELVAHAVGCPACSQLVAGVLAAERAKPLPAASRLAGWLVAAALIVALVGAALLWRSPGAGEEAYRRALVAALSSPGQTSAALWLHPPATIATSGFPVPKVFRSAEDAACAPNTPCGDALAEARAEARRTLRLLPASRRAALTYLSASVLDPETAYQALPVIDRMGWAEDRDTGVRTAAWVVRLRAGVAESASAAQAIAGLDPRHLEDAATLFNVARLAGLVGDRGLECAAWGEFLARESASPWAAEAKQRSEVCTAR